MVNEFEEFKKDYLELRDGLSDEPRFAIDKNGSFKYGPEVSCTILRLTKDIVYNGTRICRGRWITATFKSQIESSGGVVEFDRTI